jgi:hypothetical protein
MAVESAIAIDVESWEVPAFLSLFELQAQNKHRKKTREADCFMKEKRIIVRINAKLLQLKLPLQSGLKHIQGPLDKLIGDSGCLNLTLYHKK